MRQLSNLEEDVALVLWQHRGVTSSCTVM